MSGSGEFSLPDTRSQRLASSTTGEPYRLFIAPPRGDPPPAGFPTLYLLDAGATFGMLVEMLRMRRNRPTVTGVAEALVVGVAHPDHHPYDRERRQRDYTPGPREAEAGPGEGRARPPDRDANVGGSEAFFRFLARDLIPHVEAEYPVDPEARVLIGHSLAGLFTVLTLLRAPDAFRGYVAISPSLWWAPELLEREIAEMPGRLGRGTAARTLLLAVGENEQAVPPWLETMPDIAATRRRRQERRMVDGLRDFDERLRAAAGPKVRSTLEIYEDGDHASVVPIALSRALRHVIPAEGTRGPL